MALKKEILPDGQLISPSPHINELENVEKFIHSMKVQFKQLSEIQHSMKRELAQG